MTPDLPIDALEAVRASQAHLTHSLTSFLATLQQEPLPTETLLGNLSLLLSHISSLISTLQNPRFEQELKSTAVYPLSSFPVRQHETILTSLLRRKLLPDDEEWERQGREIAESLKHVDPEREDGFIEWCQNRWLEMIEGREYAHGTRTKEEREVKEENGEEHSESDDEAKGTEKPQGIGLGAALKYLNQGLEPTKPPQTHPL